jgi:hypothetical protein
MALHDEMAALVAARALARPSVRDRLAPKDTPTFTGAFAHTGTTFGMNGKTPVAKAAAIASPTAPGASYVQAQATAAKTAIDAIRTALINVGITA